MHLQRSEHFSLVNIYSLLPFYSVKDSSIGHLAIVPVHNVV